MAILFVSYSQDLFFDPAKEAAQVYEKCAKQFRWQNCYSDKFENLIKKNNFENTNSILQSLKRNDKRLHNCHSLAHVIAKGELNKSPDDWPALAKKVDAYECANGYVHGMLEGLLLSNRIELSTNSLSNFCEQAKKHLGGDENDALINCYHNIGHLLMLQSGGEIDSSLNICGSFSTSMNKYFCYSGVFMEEFVRDGLSDHGIKPKIVFNEENTKKEEQICNKYDGEVSKACWREIVTMYRALAENDPKQVLKYCSNSNNYTYQDECYSYGLYLMMTSSNLIDNTFDQLCLPLREREESYKYCIKMQIIALADSDLNRNTAKSICDNTEKFQTYCNEILNERFRIQSKNNYSL
jgi:hypothetical protein